MNPFKTNILNIYGDKGKAWLAGLPTRVEEMAAKWGLSDLQEARNLTYNYILSGCQDTQPIILKLGLDAQGFHQEAEALKAFTDFGAIHLLEEQKGALLLERALPGASLKDENVDVIPIACAVAKKLHQAPFPHTSFPHIQEWLKVLDKDLAPSDPQEHIGRYLEKARLLRDKLLPKSATPVLLHGDLHPGNILQNHTEWVAIDPKGVIGPPIHETWAFIQDFEPDTQFVADFFAFDLQEVREWYFVHLVLALCWNLEDKTSLEPFLGLAEKVFPKV